MPLFKNSLTASGTWANSWGEAMDGTPMLTSVSHWRLHKSVDANRADRMIAKSGY
jgi:hypothetical protein